MRKRQGEQTTSDEREFNALVGKIETATQALRQDAQGIINRSVTVWYIDVSEKSQTVSGFSKGFIKQNLADTWEAAA